MSRKKISARAIKAVIADLGDVFTTKDVSEDVRMKNAHPKLVKHSHYHAFVGGALSDHRGELNIKEIQKATKRGSRWQKIRLSSKRPQNNTKVYSQDKQKNLGNSLDKPITLVCPSCGGRLKKTEKNKFICIHCHNEHIIKAEDEKELITPIINEMQYMKGEFHSVQRSVDVNNAELAVARINKELSVLESELHQLEKKGKKDFGPYQIAGIGLLAVIFGVFGLFSGFPQVTLICLSIGLPIMIVGFIMVSKFDKKVDMMKERIASLQKKKQSYLQFINNFDSTH